MPKRLVEEGWKTYRQSVIPDDAPEVQVYSCLMSFYAGATSLFYTLLTALDPGSEPTPRDMNIVASIARELEEFKDSVVAFGETGRL